MEDIELENEILKILPSIDGMWSNQVFRKLNVSKERYTEIRNKMIDEKWIKGEHKKNRMYLTRLNFESSKFDDHDWTNITRTNCDNFLKYLKDNKPLFRIHRDKPFKIKKQQKMILNGFFHELDRQMIVCTRVVNAEALGLIRSSKAKSIQKKCIDLVSRSIKTLLADHKEFKEEIKEYAQSQLRTVQFKI